jgi:hypothetical protein
LGVTGAQRIGVVDRVAASEGGVNQRHRLGPDVGATPSIAEVDEGVQQLPQAEVGGQRRRKDQAGVGDQLLVIEGDRDPVQGVARSAHRKGAFRKGHGLVSQPPFSLAGRRFSRMRARYDRLTIVGSGLS